MGMDLHVREIKKVYNEFKRNADKYQDVIKSAGEAIMLYEPKWSIFNQMPYMKIIAVEFVSMHPEEASRILGRDISTYP